MVTGEKADIVGDLVPRYCQGLESGTELHQIVMRTLLRELVRCCDGRNAGELANLSGHLHVETWRGIEARAHRCTTQRQSIDALQRKINPLQIVIQHSHIT